MKKKHIQDKIKSFIFSNFFRYGLIGGLSATIDLVVFLFLYNVLGLNPLISTTISTIVGITNSFFMNAYMNFKKRDKLFKRYILFFSIGIVGLLLSALIIYMLHDVFSYNANLAKILSIPLIVILQFFLNRRFSFSDNPDDDFEIIINWIRMHQRKLLVLLGLIVTTSLFLLIVT
jgi:dolichol-phosphate mannosyltransferase